VAEPRSPETPARAGAATMDFVRGQAALLQAVATTERIRDALATEVPRAREERVLVRNMDLDGLLQRATLRADFNQATAELQRTLAGELGEVGRAFALDEVSMPRMRAVAPAAADRLAAVLAEVRALAAALSELDALNRMLGQRALSYVKAHLAVLSPKPAAYDRRGGTAPAVRASTVVRVA
jgi:hypothetical protein